MKKDILSSELQTYIYTNLKNNTKYYISQNGDVPEQIIVKQDKGDIVENDELSQVDVYGKVAAGTLQYAYEEVLGGFVLPYITHKDKYFILEVDGDSMINADIYPGDYIVVKKQNYAENMNIIVAVVDEQATLKKYLRSGKSITLLPENDRYEPISVSEQELYINGVVVGVIKEMSDMKYVTDNKEK